MDNNYTGLGATGTRGRGRPKRPLGELVLGANLVVGLLLCAFYLTDYSFTSVAANLAFATASLVMGAAVLAVASVSNDMCLAERALCLPSAAGGLVSVVVLPLSVFHLAFAGTGEVRQEAISADNRYEARLHVKLLGAWGDDQAYISVLDRRAPFVQRIVKYEHRWSTTTLTWSNQEPPTLNAGDAPINIGLIGPAVEVMGGAMPIEGGSILVIMLVGASLTLATFFHTAKFRATRVR